MEGDVQEAGTVHWFCGKIWEFCQQDGGCVYLCSSSLHEKAGKIESRVTTGLQSVKEESGVLFKVLTIRVLPIETVQRSSINKSE
jgi:hypothetical protein